MISFARAINYPSLNKQGPHLSSYAAMLLRFSVSSSVALSVSHGLTLLLCSSLCLSVPVLFYLPCISPSLPPFRLLPFLPPPPLSFLFLLFLSSSFLLFFFSSFLLLSLTHQCSYGPKPQAASQDWDKDRLIDTKWLEWNWQPHARASTWSTAGTQ